jgi:methyl coenzyme M reductase beta subunit
MAGNEVKIEVVGQIKIIAKQLENLTRQREEDQVFLAKLVQAAAVVILLARRIGHLAAVRSHLNVRSRNSNHCYIIFSLATSACLQHRCSISLAVF